MASQDFYPFLKISNTPLLSKFLHDCVDDLIGQRKIRFDNYNSDIEWTLQDYETAKRAVQAFYRQCVMNDHYELDAPELNDTIKDEIKICFTLRKEEILQAVAEDHIVLQNGHTLVKSYDWRLRWILGSSQLALLREALLQLDLHCVQKEGGIKVNNCITCEIDLDTLDDLIGELTSASATLS